MKDERLFVRMTTELRERVRKAAQERGEAESVIVREALNQYFEARTPLGKLQSVGAVSPSRIDTTDSFNDAPVRPLPSPQPTTYRKDKAR